MKSVRRGIHALIFLTGTFILLDSCHKKNDAEALPVINPTVNPIPYSVLVYLVTPSDKKIDYNYYNAAKSTILKMQSWYKTQMGNKTFVLNPVVVDTLTGLHPSIWYADNNGLEISGKTVYAYNNVKYEMK